MLHCKLEDNCAKDSNTIITKVVKQLSTTHDLQMYKEALHKMFVTYFYFTGGDNDETRMDIVETYTGLRDFIIRLINAQQGKEVLI